MKLKKIFAILLCCSTLLSTGIPVFASEKSDITSNTAVTAKTGHVKDLKSLSDKYRLQDVSVLPEGIIPLKFNSIEDADNYLSKVESEYKAEAEEAAKKEQELKKRANSPITASTISTRSETHDVGALGSSGTSLSITCKYTVDGSTIIGVSSISSYISGNTSNYSWSQTSKSWQSLDSGETAYVKVTGKLTQYIWVDGVWKSYYNTYTRYSEFYS